MLAGVYRLTSHISIPPEDRAPVSYWSVTHQRLSLGMCLLRDQNLVFFSLRLFVYLVIFFTDPTMINHHFGNMFEVFGCHCSHVGPFSKFSPLQGLNKPSLPGGYPRCLDGMLLGSIHDTFSHV